MDYYDVDKCEIFEVLDDNGNVVSRSQMCDAQGADVEDLSFTTEGECSTDDDDRSNLLTYLVDGNSKTHTLKVRFDPDFHTNYPGANLSIIIQTLVCVVTARSLRRATLGPLFQHRGHTLKLLTQPLIAKRGLIWTHQCLVIRIPHGVGASLL